MVDSLLWVMQGLDHPPYFGGNPGSENNRGLGLRVSKKGAEGLGFRRALGFRVSSGEAPLSLHSGT